MILAAAFASAFRWMLSVGNASVKPFPRGSLQAPQAWQREKRPARKALNCPTVLHFQHWCFRAFACCGARSVFSGALEAGGTVKVLRVPDGVRLSNSRLKPPKGDIAAEATAAGAGGLVFIRCKCSPDH